MISLSLWLTYVAAVFFISGTPGPNMLFAMTQGLRYGLRPIWPTLLGEVCGVLLILCLSMSGLGAILKSSLTLFTILKWIGAAYLIYLGIQMWRTVDEAAPLTDDTVNTRSCAPSFSNQFRTGLGVALSNPKAILFGLAFFPQFIHTDAPLLSQAIILLGTFAIIETAWMCIYATSGTQLSRFLASPARMRCFNRVSGSAFILAGLGLGLFGKSK
ncbi:LysE family translocator [Hydromonas duriensis]|uniref:Threonine/homoserine/homoserine lactone efflux protein n=1 Tax=Hydromonas duriensis TaxID=1527608 RepID=A0A4R6YBH5_9BURK|nr:LysE family translocator [Hydromonas duriensis]TDR32983.1 threonine/homoserine/homoserine lactone efflux protein [Hydromonas duriensis]